MQRVKDIHASLSSLMGFTLIGVMWSIADSRWWSCSNNDEQILELWTYGSIGLGFGVITTLIARHYGHIEKLKYFVELGAKLLLIYSLITVAMIKTEGLFYDLSLITKQHKLSELDSSAFAHAFYGYSSFFQSYSGAIIVAGLCMLCFRSSSRLGVLILLGSLVNYFVLNHSFESCFILKNGISLAAVMYLMYNDVFAFVSYLTKSKPYVNYTWSPISETHHLYTSASLYKLVLLAGLLFYNHDYVKDIKDHRGRNKDNPIAGVWKVDRIDFLTGNMSEKVKEELEEFDRIILDKDRFGAVSVDDSLSYFEFIVNPQDNQLEFWNFYDYREFDIKGKYEQVAPDTLLYTGRNNKDSIQIVLTLDN